MAYSDNGITTAIIVVTSAIIALCLFYFAYRTIVHPSNPHHSTTSPGSSSSGPSPHDIHQRRTSRVSPLLFRYNQPPFSPPPIFDPNNVQLQINFGSIEFDDCIENHHMSLELDDPPPSQV